MMIQATSSRRSMSGAFERSTFAPRAVADGEGQDHDADHRREEEDDPQLEEEQRVHPGRVGRGLLGE